MVKCQQQNFRRYVGVPQQNLPNYDPGNVQYETYPQNASGYNMERHTNSRDMMG